MFNKKRIMIVMLIGLSLAIITGCGTKFTVNDYPTFYNPSLSSVAVLPFENKTSRKGAGMAVASHLAVALTANGTYKVTGPVRLKQILEDKGMPALQQNNYKAVAEELANLDKYQAFIAGSVLSESFVNAPLEYYEDYDFYYDDYPSSYYPYWYYPYWYYPYYSEFTGEAYVSVYVAMVGIPEGTELHTATVEAGSDVGGAYPSLKRYAIQMALDNLSEKIVSDFAIVPVRITVHPDKAIRTANSFEQGIWHYTQTFSSDQESIYVVLCLPESAAMNKFKLTITPRGNPSNIISSKDFTWEAGKPCQSIKFSPKQIAAYNGPGKYSVQFHARGKVVMSRNFRIK
jgi:hypothetical protein